jgi:hypothetical protein
MLNCSSTSGKSFLLICSIVLFSFLFPGGGIEAVSSCVDGNCFLVCSNAVQ